MTDDKNKPDENKLIAERRAKLHALREQGNAFPNDFRRNAIAEELHQTFHAHDKEALEEEQVEVSVSGRMMAKRVMGKASFIKLQDRSGQIQVRLERDRLPDGVYAAIVKYVAHLGRKAKRKISQLWMQLAAHRRHTRALKEQQAAAEAQVRLSSQSPPTVVVIYNFTYRSCRK